MFAKGKFWTKKRLLTSKGMVQAAKNIVVQSLSHVLLFMTPWTVVHQASLSLTSPEFAQVHVSEFSSVQFSHSVVSDSLQPHESQHARPPCPSPTPRVHPEFTQTHIHRVSDAIQPSHPLSSPSPPAPYLSQHQSLFQ